MPKNYFVLSNDGEHEHPTISQHEKLEDALTEYRLWLKQGNEPVLLRRIAVGLIASSDDLPTGNIEE